jgi:hypothetical protein
MPACIAAVFILGLRPHKAADVVICGTVKAFNMSASPFPRDRLLWQAYVQGLRRAVEERRP